MITILGGSGFIGTRLCARLRDSKALFQIIDKAPSTFFPDDLINADIRYPLLINFFMQPSALINLAAEHRDDIQPKSLYDDVNVLGAKNVCDLARTKGISKIIFTSSVAVYGFAPLNTNEFGAISPFNDYGRTKWEAEQIYKKWQLEDPNNRTLVIIRPTVVFGERNRGNVYNLLKQIASGKFVMVGDGLNRKSMAYVENVAAVLEYALNFKPGIHIYNYIDKPDFTMNQLVAHVNKLLNRSKFIKLRSPIFFGLLIGLSFDLVAKITGLKFSISAIRIKKFCANSVYDSAINETGFSPPVHLIDAIDKTIRFEFLENHKNEQVFYSE
jgi:nucleoside-diphosphate-sugar epimerase